MKKHLKTGLISLICMILFSPFAAIARQGKAAGEPQPLASVLSALAAQYKINFLYEEANVTHQKVKYDASLYKGKPIAEILNSILTPLNLSWYKVDAQNYSIFPKPAPAVPGIHQVNNFKLSGQDSLVRDQVGGRVLDEHQQPLAYTKVTLLAAVDSVVVLNAITDPDGNFNFAAIKAGTYKIRISAIGKSPYTTKTFTVGGSAKVVMETIAMQASEETLKEVKITSARPLVDPPTVNVFVV